MMSDAVRVDDVGDRTAVDGKQQRSEYRALGTPTSIVASDDRCCPSLTNCVRPCKKKTEECMGLELMGIPRVCHHILRESRGVGSSM